MNVHLVIKKRGVLFRPFEVICKEWLGIQEFYPYEVGTVYVLLAIHKCFVENFALFLTVLYNNPLIKG